MKKKMTLEDFAKFFQEEVTKFIVHINRSFVLSEKRRKERALLRSTKRNEFIMLNNLERIERLERYA